MEWSKSHLTFFLCRTVDSHHHVELVWNIQQNQHKRRPALYQHSPTGVQLDLLWSTVPKLFHSPASLPTNIIRSLVTFCRTCPQTMCFFLLTWWYICADKQKQFSHLCGLLMQRGRASPRPLSNTNPNRNTSTNTNTNQQKLMQWFAEGGGLALGRYQYRPESNPANPQEPQKSSHPHQLKSRESHSQSHYRLV